MRKFLTTTAATLVATSALAFDGQKWSSVDADTRTWFESLRNGEGTSCCGSTDGVRVEDPEWRQLPDGTYEVMARGSWHSIRADHVLRGTNRVGYAILWWPPSMAEPTCFLPGTRG